MNIRMCWPANIVGAFFIALLIFDIIQKNYSALPYHGITGILLSALLWGLCILVGPNITMATLVVPLVFVGIFLFSVWVMDESMKSRGCCMTCGKKGHLTKGHLVKKPDHACSIRPSSTPIPSPKPTPTPSPAQTCIPKLTATQTSPLTCDPPPKPTCTT